MKKIMNLLNDNNGQATVLIAISLIALLGFAALAVDVGNVYVEKSKMQKALDAGVLAGAQELILTKSETMAEEAADLISEKNSYSLDIHGDTESPNLDDGQVVATALPDKYSVLAKKSKKVDMYFARVLGFNSMNVAVKAKAVVGSIVGVKGLVPIGIASGDVPEDPFIENITLAFPPGNDRPGPGNFGFLDLDGNHGGGTPEVVNRVLNGYEGKVSVDSEIFTETGGATDIYNAFKTRINRDTGITKCQSAETADFTCNRLVYIPVINQWVNGQSDPVRIVGFAVFFLEDLEEIDEVSNGNTNTGNTGNNGNGNGQNNGNGNSGGNNNGNTENNSNGNGNKTKLVTGTFVKKITQGELDEELSASEDFGLYGTKLTE